MRRPLHRGYMIPSTHLGQHLREPCTPSNESGISEAVGDLHAYGNDCAEPVLHDARNAGRYQNAPVAYARQTNFNNGGQQQINNGPPPTSRPASAHTEETVFEPNDLLEDHTHDRTQLDSRARENSKPNASRRRGRGSNQPGSAPLKARRRHAAMLGGVSIGRCCAKWCGC